MEIKWGTNFAILPMIKVDNLKKEKKQNLNDELHFFLKKVTTVVCVMTTQIHHTSYQ